MNIGIDIDDTIVDTITPMTKYANIFNHEEFGATEDKFVNGLVPSAHYLEEIFKWNEETKDKFFNKYYLQILKECKIRKNAGKVIAELKKQGHTINFITARFQSEPNCNSEEITKETLAKYNICYDNLIMDKQKKADACKSLNIDIFIDDSYDQCKFLQSQGIKSYLITTKMNDKLKINDVIRVSSWQDFYNKITNTKKH